MTHSADMVPDPAIEVDVSPGAGLRAILDGLEAFFASYIAFTHFLQGVVCALWTAHTYVFHHFEVTPYLHITAPTRRAGKSRVLECLELVVREAWRCASTTEAALARRIDQRHPTLLLDQVENIMGGRMARSERSQTLQAILNSGFAQGSAYTRCVGEGANMTTRDFDIYCPKAFAGVGSLPDAVEDRAIPLALQRRDRRQHAIQRFRRKGARAQGEALAAALEAWAREIPAEQLEAPIFDLPEDLHDRALDAWEVLFWVADQAGGHWPARAREAARVLHGEADLEEGDENIRLLAAIRSVYADQGDPDFLPTVDLLKALVASEEAPTAKWWERQLKAEEFKGPARELASRLRPFKVRPGQQWAGGENIRGYLRADFLDAWARYLPPLSPSPPSIQVEHARHARALATQGLARENNVAREAPSSDIEIVRQTLQDKASSVCSDLDVLEGEAAGNGRTALDRARLLAFGLWFGFRRLEFAPGLAIPEGEAAWRAFAERAPNDAFAAALRRIRGGNAIVS